ncbi:MAG: helix-turn-helix domain-containing protein [Rhizobiaceae bacterium]|nr:helix-turn-helix domain-containing protein [Rhizobiaceae bacterium]
MVKRASWWLVKIHRSYTVEEVSRLLGVSKATVWRWIKNGLVAIQDRKPALISGANLIDFLKSRSRPKQKCALDECYCFTCKSPRKIAFGEAEIDCKNSNIPNMLGLCSICSSLMFKRISKSKLSEISTVLRLTFKQGDEPISNRPPPCLNDHLQQEQDQ